MTYKTKKSTRYVTFWPLEALDLLFRGGPSLNLSIAEELQIIFGLFDKIETI